jgi:tetratricopeptide (TPR) repeat protein
MLVPAHRRLNSVPEAGAMLLGRRQPMECNETNDLSPREALEPLMNEYVEAQRKLKEAKSHRRRQQLKRELNILKIDLGWTLMDCGKPEEGLALYKLLPWTTHGETKCNGMTRALTEMKSYDEARRLLGAGLKRYPDSYMLWVGLGTLNDALGDNFGALKCSEIAIQCAPERNWEARYNKAITLEKLSSYEEAAEILDGLIDECPEDPKFLAERGCCSSSMGYPQDALRYFQGAMKFWPKDPSVNTGISIYAGLCHAYFELGEKRKAMELALEGLKRYPGEDAILYHNVGASFWELGWKEEARDVLKEGLEKFPEDEELGQFFKDANEDMDDPDGGIKPPILGLMLLTAILQKRFGRR